MQNTSGSGTGALIGAAASVAGQALGGLFTGKANKKTREWNERMYALQKQDNIAQWERNNSYNSPEQQMQRLQKAGLNPNLVYGNGAVANSSSPADTPHAMPYRPEIPQVNLPQIADTYFNIQSRAQELSNQKKIGDNLTAELALKGAELTSKQLGNKFTAETYLSKVRGFRGDNEQKYSNAIKTYINKELLETLNNSATSIGNGQVNQTTTGDSMLTKDWMQKFNGQGLLNKLRSGEIENKKSLTGINQIKEKYQKRLMSGELSDLGSKDILQMLIQMLGR